MSYTLDFKAIAATPIADVARLLGFSLTEKNEQLVGQCPISQLTNPTAFKITPAMNRFVCFCSECKKLPKQGGDVIEMVRRFRRFAGAREAAAEIQKLCGAGKAAANPPTQQEAASSSKATGFDPLTYLETLDPAHDALKDIGVSEQTLRLYRAGFCSKGLNRGRLAVAWADVTGTIKAFIGVGLNNESPIFPKNWVVAYWFGVDHVEEGGELRIVPTILDVLQSAENGCTTICPLTLTDGDAMTSLQSLVATYKLTVEF